MRNTSKGLIGKAKILQASANKELNSIVCFDDSKGSKILSDQDAVMIRRLATSRYLDFPEVLRGDTIFGEIKLGDSLVGTKLGEFLSESLGELALVFFEPWELRGAALLDCQELMKNIWEILEYSDNELKIYNIEISKGCVVSEGGDGRTMQYKFLK